LQQQHLATQLDKHLNKLEQENKKLKERLDEHKYTRKQDNREKVHLERELLKSKEEVNHLNDNISLMKQSCANMEAEQFLIEARLKVSNRNKSSECLPSSNEDSRKETEVDDEVEPM